MLLNKTNFSGKCYLFVKHELTAQNYSLAHKQCATKRKENTKCKQTDFYSRLLIDSKT